MKLSLKFAIVVAMIIICAGSSVVAEEAGDKSGTNPILFTNDFRIYVELQGLNADDSGAQTFTFEYRRPLHENLQLRARMRAVSRSVDVDGDGRSETTAGVGDFDMRLLTVPYSNNSWAIAAGLESFWNTATDDLLGEGQWSLGPQLFAVKFAPFGLAGTLVAPAYQHVVSVAGERGRTDVNRSQLDIFFLWLSKDKKNWVLVDPQAVIDHENDVAFGLIEAEVGQIMFGGFSSYVRPGVGVGEDRPLDWNAEVGFKVVWR
ncbi:MAG: hypothetical protein ACI8TX_003822 [Hyphomicrobiaceae bacterium]|jgi:hypothetical protein